MKMNKARLAVFVLLSLSLLIVSHVAFAQNEDLIACGACGSIGGAIIFVIIGVFVLNIVLLVWVARDAKARGMDNSVVWMLVVFFLGIIGLIIYLASRPKGDLVECSNCNNKRLERSATCPHCGNA